MFRAMQAACSFASWELFAAKDLRPVPVSVADAKAPPGTEMSVIRKAYDYVHRELVDPKAALGRDAVMYSLPKADDSFISSLLQGGVWWNGEPTSVCASFFSFF